MFILSIITNNPNIKLLLTLANREILRNRFIEFNISILKQTKERNFFSQSISTSVTALVTMMKSGQNVYESEIYFAVLARVNELVDKYIIFLRSFTEFKLSQLVKTEKAFSVSLIDSLIKDFNLKMETFVQFDNSFFNQTVNGFTVNSLFDTLRRNLYLFFIQKINTAIFDIELLEKRFNISLLDDEFVTVNETPLGLYSVMLKDIMYMQTNAARLSLFTTQNFQKFLTVPLFDYSKNCNGYVFIDKINFPISTYTGCSTLLMPLLDSSIRGDNVIRFNLPQTIEELREFYINYLVDLPELERTKIVGVKRSLLLKKQPEIFYAKTNRLLSKFTLDSKSVQIDTVGIYV